MNMTPEETRYSKIKQLIDAEIDEAMEEEKEHIKFDNEREEESFRDDMIANYLAFLKDDLQSDNAWHLT